MLSATIQHDTGQSAAAVRLRDISNNYLNVEAIEPKYANKNTSSKLTRL